MLRIVPPLADRFATLPDPRQAQGKRHSLRAILLLACVAMLAGARGPSGIADWAKNDGEPWRTRLGFTHAKGPSQSTLQRVFAQLAVETLEIQLAQWSQQVMVALAAPAPDQLDGVALDGKQMRMSARCGATAAHLLSTFSHRLGLVLGQVAVADKRNEITASDDVLAQLLLTGVVVTGDAGALWAGSPSGRLPKRSAMRTTTTCSSSRGTSRRCMRRFACCSPIPMRPSSRRRA